MRAYAPGHLDICSNETPIDRSGDDPQPGYLTSMAGPCPTVALPGLDGQSLLSSLRRRCTLATRHWPGSREGHCQSRAASVTSVTRGTPGSCRNVIGPNFIPFG